MEFLKPGDAIHVSGFIERQWNAFVARKENNEREAKVDPRARKADGGEGRGRIQVLLP